MTSSAKSCETIVASVEATAASVKAAAASARKTLLDARGDEGLWTGKLSSSALSTATAAVALASIEKATGEDRFNKLVAEGIDWLVRNQNEDGGWGDTIDSPSNISTSILGWCALSACTNIVPCTQDADARVTSWLEREIGDLAPESIANAMSKAYGKDRTFSVPILTMCALSGRLGEGSRAWRLVASLPFELAMLPRSWFGKIGLPVVSYALPALIAIGLVRHHSRPSANPILRLIRNLAVKPTLRILASIQPECGGFLEATPLTSFVTMSLAAAGKADCTVVSKAVRFLEESVRPDGSWPIDSNLSVWLTTLSVNALASETDGEDHLGSKAREELLDLLLSFQQRTVHEYTRAAPGGWAWTHLPGGVPDADDTAGALLALWNLTSKNDLSTQDSTDVIAAAERGLVWLMDLQNRDGGIPTFCRGWGKLPFDKSSPDLTAHAIRAWQSWRNVVQQQIRQRIDRQSERAIRFLLGSQKPDGSWHALWFGNQRTPDMENPLYGTSRVVLAPIPVTQNSNLHELWAQAIRHSIGWICDSQNEDGGWGASSGVPSSIEETALAIEALSTQTVCDTSSVRKSCVRGCEYLVKMTEGGTKFASTPIGLYFARLWYSEKLYPHIFTASALTKSISKILRDANRPPS